MGEKNGLIRDDLVCSVKEGNAWRPIGKLASGAKLEKGCLFIEGDNQKEYLVPHISYKFSFADLFAIYQWVKKLPQKDEENAEGAEFQ